MKSKKHQVRSLKNEHGTWVWIFFSVFGIILKDILERGKFGKITVADSHRRSSIKHENRK